MKHKLFLGVVLVVIIVAVFSLARVFVYAQGESENSNAGGNGAGNALGLTLGNNPNSGDNSQSSESEQGNQSTQSGMNIGAQGQVRVTNADAVSFSGNSLSIKIFGLPLTVDTTSAQITGALSLPPLPTSSSTASSTAMPTQTSIASGDKVSVNGTIDPNTGIIKATVVHDLTADNQSTSNIRDRINQLLQMINQLRAQLGM